MSSSAGLRERQPDVSNLERAWHGAFEASVRARADYFALAGNPDALLEEIDRAREHFEQSEAGKNRVLNEIDRQVALQTSDGCIPCMGLGR